MEEITTQDSTILPATTVIVARHGERLDYYLRDYKSANFLTLSSSTRPWDPPLTNRGRVHGRKLGEKIRAVLRDLNLGLQHENSEFLAETIAGDGGERSCAIKIPPLKFVYSSPMMRCMQTGAEAVMGYIGGLEKDAQMMNNAEPLKVRVEFGLMESMNEKWYRSWCLPDSDGTWGGPKGHAYINGNFPPQARSEENIKPHAKVPCVQLLSSGKEIQHNLSKLASLEQENGWMDDSLSNTTKEEYALIDNSDLTEYIDIESKCVYDRQPQYCWQSFESTSQVETRIEETIERLAEKHPNETILILSHGSPCTKAYTKLTRDDWQTHGVSTYASFSIYRKHSTGKGNWDALVTNESTHIQDLQCSLEANESKIP